MTLDQQIWDVDNKIYYDIYDIFHFFLTDTSDHTPVKKNSKIYIIIGMSSLALLVLVTLVSAIFCSHWKTWLWKNCQIKIDCMLNMRIC